jgi:hypothetical protein
MTAGDPNAGIVMCG